MSNKPFILLFWLLFPTLPLRAEANIQRHFPNLREYRFVMEQEQTNPDGGADLGGFLPAFLRDADLTSYSSWSVHSSSGSAAPLRMEVFECTDLAGAYMLYSLWPEAHPGAEGRPTGPPISNLLFPGSGIFWRGNFFFQVSAGDGQNGLDEGRFRHLVEQVSAAVPLENMLPVSVTHIPQPDLVAGSLRFYLGAESLATNDRFPEPLLKEIGFTDRIEIAFARYAPGDDALFLIGYPTPQLADEYFLKLQNRLQGYFSRQGIYMKRSGVLVCLFAGPESRALEILPRVKYSPSIKWLYDQKESMPSETMTFLGLITKTVLGIGTFLILLFGSGAVVGFLRYEFIRRFPHLFRRQQMVELGLRDLPVREDPTRRAP